MSTITELAQTWHSIGNVIQCVPVKPFKVHSEVICILKYYRNGAIGSAVVWTDSCMAQPVPGCKWVLHKHYVWMTQMLFNRPHNLGNVLALSHKCSEKCCLQPPLSSSKVKFNW